MGKGLHVHLQEAGEVVRRTRAAAKLLRAGNLDVIDVAAVERCAELLSQARGELFALRRELKSRRPDGGDSRG